MSGNASGCRPKHGAAPPLADTDPAKPGDPARRAEAAGPSRSVPAAESRRGGWVPPLFGVASGGPWGREVAGTLECCHFRQCLCLAASSFARPEPKSQKASSEKSHAGRFRDYSCRILEEREVRQSCGISTVGTLGVDLRIVIDPEAV